MRNPLRRALKLALSALSVLTLTIGTAQAQYVHTDGENIVDASGHPLFLKGMNLGNWFEVEGYMFHFDGGPQSPHEIEALTRELLGPARADAFWHQWRENYITKPDIDRLAAAGFNSIRVPLHYKFFATGDSEGFRLLDRVVAWAAQDHIYVILD